MSKYILTLMYGLILGWVIGWYDAHITVGTECKRLGAFYIGSTVFKCIAIEIKEKS